MSKPDVAELSALIHQSAYVTDAAEEARRRVHRACDPVGAVEIATRLGVSRSTVDSWRQRKVGFPEPRWTVGGRPAWNFDDVEAWYTSRKPVG